MRWLDGITDSGVDDEQGSLVCCSPGGHKESDTELTETKAKG